MRAIRLTGAIAALLAAQPLLACRYPQNPDSRKALLEAQAVDDWHKANVVVRGELAQFDSACDPKAQRCQEKVIAANVVKGAERAEYPISTDEIVVGCSPNSIRVGEAGVFFLWAKGDDFLIFRSEQSTKVSDEVLRLLGHNKPPVEEAAE